MFSYITLEEHFLAEAIKLHVAAVNAKQFELLRPDAPMLLADLTVSRFESMKKNNIGLQVVSHLAYNTHLPADIISAANDELAKVISANKTKLAGFATLAMKDPEAAVAELMRCVKDLGLVGALIDNHTHDEFYDDAKFWPIFHAAEALDVPIYLHPTYPTPDALTLGYSGNFDERVSGILGTFAWGWHEDCGRHVLRLFAAGVFDAFPRLKIIIGHFGEMLPAMLDRVELVSSRLWDKPDRPFAQVWNENIWITTSGVWSTDPMHTILRNTQIEHILYTVDYPLTPNEAGTRFMEDLQNSGLLTGEQFKMIAFKNAEKLLKVNISS